MLSVRNLVFLGILAAALAEAQGFGGPAVMGRSLGAGIGRRSGQVRFRPFASVRAVYDSGLTAFRVNPDGTVGNSLGTAGIELNGGVYGSKSWRRTQLVASYLGGYRRYPGDSPFNGSEHSGTFGLSHAPSARLGFQSSNTAGTLIRSAAFGLSLTNPFQSSDPAFTGVPTNEVFDTRLNFFSSANTVSYALSPRLSAAATGGIFNTQRAGSLVSGSGIMAGGDLSRRFNRTSTGTIAYNFMRFSFAQQFGFSGVQEIAFAYAREVGRRFTVQLRVGGFQVENEGVETVQLSPEIAELLGTTQGARAFYRRNYFPSLRVALLGRFKAQSIGTSFARTILPGNGIILTSRNESFSAYYNYTGIRKWIISGNFAYNRMDGLLRFSQSNRTTIASVRAGYQLRRSWQVNVAFDGRIQSLSIASTLPQEATRVSVGLSWSPGDIPLAFW